MHGPHPKAPSKRRNTTKPVSWGAAEPVTIPIPAAGPQNRVLGIDQPHELVARMWTVLADFRRSPLLQRGRLGQSGAGAALRPHGAVER